MEKVGLVGTMPISIRNNLKYPFRITMAISGVKENTILITISPKATRSLKDFYGICVDRIVKPDADWGKIGSLDMTDLNVRLNIKGRR